MENKIIALGMTAQEWIDLLKGDAHTKVQKALNYLDGRQEEEVIAILNDPNSGRSNWKQKGFIPRYRNITKMIVEKSALLFTDNLPCFEIYNGPDDDAMETQKFQEEIDKIPFAEIMANVDQVLRLVKSVFLLFQYDSTAEELVIDILHHGNCEVIVDGSKKIQGLIYSTGSNTYRVFTVDEIIDLMVQPNKDPFVTSIVPNPYGIVPATPFYDTRIPRQGVWMTPDCDIISLNESYNLHLTDSDYSMKHAKLPTLVLIDCEVDGEQEQRIQQVLSPGAKLPSTRPLGPDVSGGPGSIIYLATNGQGGGSAEYKGPTADIAGMDKVYEDWAAAVAADWSVRMHTSSSSTKAANSGFQLLVEELPNLELRKQRQRMYESAFKRAWDPLRTVLNVSSPQSFKEGTDLFVEFSDPHLPVDASVQEDVWSKRINEGRATVLDYFTQELGMSDADAEEKYLEIVRFNAMKQTIANTINTVVATEPIAEEVTTVLAMDAAEEAGDLPEEGIGLE